MQLIRVHIHGVKVYEQLGMGPYYMPHLKDWTIFFLTKGSKETTLQKHLETKKHLKEAAKIQMKPETKKVKAKANIQNETPKISELSLGEGKLKIT